MSSPTDPDALDLPPDLQPLGWLVGLWRGEGVGGYPTIEADFAYAQEIAFRPTPNGRALAYASRAWRLPDERPLQVETGYWRLVPGTLDLEVTLTAPTGIAEVGRGKVLGTSAEFATGAVRTGTAKEVDGTHRIYGLVEGDLGYAVDLAAVGQPLQSHLSARLQRVTG